MSTALHRQRLRAASGPLAPAGHAVLIQRHAIVDEVPSATLADEQEETQQLDMGESPMVAVQQGDEL